MENESGRKFYQKMERKEITITLAEVKKLMADEFWFFEKMTSENVFCGSCHAGKGPVGMDIHRVLLSPLNDIVAEGICKECGKLVARYLETGENPDFSDRADVFRRKSNKKQ